jgi:FAD/FMN-containing dehydrogenase
MTNTVRSGADALRDAIDGQVILPGDADFDVSRLIWNGAIDRTPAVVARCTSPADVAAALVWAQATGIEVAVRGGGHSVAGAAIAEGGLTIDLSELATVVVDPVAKRARCGPGAALADLDAACQEHGLAVPAGTVSHTGVAGLTLGGGFGWLSRMAGLTIDNLVSAEVVLVDGRIVLASEAEHPDLFWALRGGGGNFGVVTEFEFRLHAVGPMLQLGLFLFSPDQGGDLFRFARDYVETLPDECGVFMAGLSAPPEPFVPDDLHFTPVFALVVVGFEGEKEHARLIAPIREALTPLVEMLTPIPYVGLQQMFDASAPWGMHNYEKAAYLAELTDGAIEAIVEHQAKKMSPLSFVPIFVLGGEYRKADEDAGAFGGSREFRYVINVSATAMSPDDYDAERSWSRQYWSALVEHAVGVGSYVNFMTEYEEDRVRNSYGAKYERLQRIKAAYDPDNIFHLNVNIPPST